MKYYSMSVTDEFDNLWYFLWSELTYTRMLLLLLREKPLIFNELRVTCKKYYLVHKNIKKIKLKKD